MNTLTTSRLILKTIELEDAPKLVRFYRENIEHLSLWETKKDLSDPVALSTFEERVVQWEKEYHLKTSLRFIIFLKDDPNKNIIGQCHFTQIYLGPFKACYLGYQIDHRHEGQGLMTETLKIAIPYIFDEYDLNRIMANYMPENKRSAKLLCRLNFAIEGYARKYLLVNNEWKDHVLTSLTRDRWSAQNLDNNI